MKTKRLKKANVNIKLFNKIYSNAISFMSSADWNSGSYYLEHLKYQGLVPVLNTLYEDNDNYILKMLDGVQMVNLEVLVKKDPGTFITILDIKFTLSQRMFNNQPHDIAYPYSIELSSNPHLPSL